MIMKIGNLNFSLAWLSVSDMLSTLTKMAFTFKIQTTHKTYKDVHVLDQTPPTVAAKTSETIIQEPGKSTQSH